MSLNSSGTDARDRFPEESGYAYCTEYVKHKMEKKIDRLPPVLQR